MKNFIVVYFITLLFFRTGTAMEEESVIFEDKALGSITLSKCVKKRNRDISCDAKIEVLEGSYRIIFRLISQIATCSNSIRLPKPFYQVRFYKKNPGAILCGQETFLPLLTSRIESLPQLAWKKK